MSFTYVMEAKENYDPTRAAQADGAGFPVNTSFEGIYLGLGFDPVRREFSYSGNIALANGNPTITNTTGFTQWDGVTALAPDDAFNPNAALFYHVVRKNIDTGVVTAHDVNNNGAYLVPAGIGGGDGTWRRTCTDPDPFSATDEIENNYPLINDPRSGDVWFHEHSCDLYVFRRADGYAMAISPLRPASLTTNHVWPLCMNDDWVFATELNAPGNPNLAKLLMTPRQNTADEIAADVKLAYATYVMDSYFYGAAWHVTVGKAGDVWLYACPSGSSNDFRLWKFTQPSAFVYPTPPIDGGFTDKTPWTSTTGPNDNDYFPLPNWYSHRTQAFFNPGRTVLNLITAKVFHTDNNWGGVFHTWYDVTDDSWGSANWFSGWVKADFTSTLDPAEAAFQVSGRVWPTNLYLDIDNYFEDADYATRWLFVEVYPIDGDGNPDLALPRVVLLQVRWNDAALPTILQILDEGDTWDPAYTAYGTAISDDQVVRASLCTANFYFKGAWTIDTGLYDATTNAFWWSGYNTVDGFDDNMFQLDPSFAGRAANNAQPPFLRLTFSEVLVFANSFVRSYVGNPQL